MHVFTPQLSLDIRLRTGENKSTHFSSDIKTGWLKTSQPTFQVILKLGGKRKLTCHMMRKMRTVTNLQPACPHTQFSASACSLHQSSCSAVIQ